MTTEPNPLTDADLAEMEAELTSAEGQWAAGVSASVWLVETFYDGANRWKLDGIFARCTDAVDAVDRDLVDGYFGELKTARWYSVDLHRGLNDHECPGVRRCGTCWEWRCVVDEVAVYRISRHSVTTPQWIARAGRTPIMFGDPPWDDPEWDDLYAIPPLDGEPA